MRKNVDVEHFQLGLQHEFVMADTNEADGMKSVRLYLPFGMSHEVKHGSKDFLHRLVTLL